MDNWIYFSTPRTVNFFSLRILEDKINKFLGNFWYCNSWYNELILGIFRSIVLIWIRNCLINIDYHSRKYLKKKSIRVCFSSWINSDWIIVRLKKKITIFIYRYLSIRKKTLRRTLFIENENNESFHRKTTHLTRNRTRRNDELIESTWSSYSLLLFFSPREKTRIRNKDGLGWIIETSFYATRTIHHANCISCGEMPSDF